MYNFKDEEKEFIKRFNFDYEVDKNMTDEQLINTIETIQEFIVTKGIENDEENELGKIGADILNKMAQEDNEDTE